MKDATFPPNYLWIFDGLLRSELARVSTEVVEYDMPTLVRTHGLSFLVPTGIEMFSN